jgi:phosphoribosylglycinamide formyltransferase-1
MYRSLRIGVFAYNFPHKKTEEGLFRLFASGVQVDAVMAADPVELSFYQSQVRVAPKGLEYIHPRQIAAQLEAPYHVVPHSSEECVDIIKANNLDVGIILGARIIPEETIRAFNIGILNMHPGLLPENRGLDNLKWAVLRRLKQGVSCHLIDKKIDRGQLICRSEIDVYADDTLLDVFLRIQNLELRLMMQALNILAGGERKFPAIGTGTYFKSVPPEEEARLEDAFERYKLDYSEL